MLLYYIRHGEPTYDPDCLTPNGERQAEAIARRLARYGVDKIYSSSSIRAQQTARPTAELTRREVVTLDWCHEDYAKAEMMLPSNGDPTGSSPSGGGKRRWCFYIPEIVTMMNSREVRALDDKWYDYPGFPPNRFKEGVLRVDREVDAWLDGLGYHHDREQRCFIPIAPTEERVALFAHHGFGMLFFSSVLDIPYPQFATRFDQSFTGLSVIHFYEEGGKVFPRMLELSNDAHLYKDNLPTKYNYFLDF